MKIGIVGLGAIGTLLSTHLLHHRGTAAYEIFCLVKPQQYRVLGHNGLRIHSQSSPTLSYRNEMVHTIYANHFPRPMDIVFLLLKMYDLPTAIRDCISREKEKEKLQQTIWIPMSNGIGQGEMIQNILPSSPVYRGLTYLAGYQIDVGETRLVGRGVTYLEKSDNQEHQKKLQTVQGLLNQSNLPCELLTNQEMNKRVWKKLMANAVINPITSILNESNGCILKGKHTMDLAEGICNEVLQVAEKEKIQMNFKVDAITSVLDVVRKTENNICSMLFDLRNGRR